MLECRNTIVIKYSATTGCRTIICDCAMRYPQRPFVIDSTASARKITRRAVVTDSAVLYDQVAVVSYPTPRNAPEQSKPTTKLVVAYNSILHCKRPVINDAAA